MTSDAMRELPLPSFFDRDNAAKWEYRANPEFLLSQAHDWKRKHNLRSGESDKSKVQLLLVDMQKDFCFPDGSLYVGGRSGKGATDDSARLAEFIYRNLESITDITCTMDTHFPHQVFFPSFWQDRDGVAVAPHTIITTDDVCKGRVMPNPGVAWWVCDGDYAWLQKQVQFYCEELEKAGKYKLYLWPPHCLLGDEGHALAGLIQEARLFHSFARGASSRIEIKGDITLTENYSILSPEVLLCHDGHPLAERNSELVRTLLESDKILIAGQAASHCVKSSIEDLLSEISNQNQDLVKKIYILKDCMSAVAVPDPNNPGTFLNDFTQEAEEAFERFEDAGMHVVSSTERFLTSN